MCENVLQTCLRVVPEHNRMGRAFATLSSCNGRLLSEVLRAVCI